MILQLYKSYNPAKNWSISKRHWQDHAYKDILAKGVTRGYNTKPFEQLHGALKAGYHEQTNGKNIGPQVRDSDCEQQYIKSTSYIFVAYEA